MSRKQNQGCLLAFLQLLGLSPGEVEGAAGALPYRQRDDFLSAAELSFYHVLHQTVGERFTICCKVRLADLLFVINRRENVSSANKIDRKHVDFVLCDPQTMRPLIGVELDDSSHARRDRQERDQFVDDAFAAASLPLVRFAAKRQYDPHAIAEALATAWQHARSSGPANSATLRATSGASPACPKCGVAMVVRRAKRGPRQGQQFYACPNYPKCKATFPYEG